MQEQQLYLIEIAKEQNLNALKDFINQNKGFNFDFTNKNGDTLLHFAVEKLTSRTLPFIQILLEVGIDPTAVNEKFNTPLDVAKTVNNIPALTLMKHFINKKNQEIQTYI